jgi:hypothetical protein
LFPETASGGFPTLDGDASVRATTASGASNRAAGDTLMFVSSLDAWSGPLILVDRFGVAAACNGARD